MNILIFIDKESTKLIILYFVQFYDSSDLQLIVLLNHRFVHINDRYVLESVGEEVGACIAIKKNVDLNMQEKRKSFLLRFIIQN
jgi:hypothetical protein